MTNPTVIGVAVYFELTKPNMTQQIVLMPEGTTPSGKQIPMTMYRRRLTISSPRKTWRQTVAPISMHKELIERATLGAGAASTVDSKNTLIDAAMSLVIPMFAQLKTNSWVLYKSPIFVEVTVEDLELARLGKTPHKVLSRIWKSRKAMGFPKEYLHDLTAPSSVGI